MIYAKTLKMAATGAVASLAMLAPPLMAAGNPFDPAAGYSGYTLAAADGSGKCGGGMGAQKNGCRMMRMDANGDGKVSREEFMQGHAAMFDKMDSNGDGMLDMDEQHAHRAMMKDQMTGKCGQQKSAE